MARDDGPLAVAGANRAFMRRFIEEFRSAGDLSRVGEILPPDYIEPGLEGYKRR